MATISDGREGVAGTTQHTERSALLPSERRACSRRTAAVQQRITRTWLRELAGTAPRRDHEAAPYQGAGA